MKETTNKRPEQLDSALSWAEDTLSRAQIPFVLLGQTLESVVNNEQVAGDKIELGIMKGTLTESCKGLLELLLPDVDVNGDYICFEKDDVPIEVKVIKKNFKVFKRPNIVFYKITEYKIPNPLESYRKQRYLIR